MTVTAVTLRAIPGHNPPLASRTLQECQYRSGMSAAEYAARYGGMPEAKFGSNENAAGVSPSAVEAVRPTSEGIHRYPPMQDDGFREILRPDDFTYDVDAIRAAVDASTRLVFLCSPNNPTGTTCPPEEITHLARSLPRPVLCRYWTRCTTTVPTVRGAHSRFLMTMSSSFTVFSKAFGLAGARLGFAIAKASIAREVAAYRLPFHIGALTLAAGIAA